MGLGVSQREAAIASRVLDQVERRHPACSLLRDPSAVTFAAGPPSAALLATLGVLGRPATSSDRFPVPLPEALRGFDVRGVYADYVRRARVAFGRSYYLVPAASVHYVPPLPRRCRHLYVRQLQRDLPRGPALVRRKVQSLLLGLLAAVQKKAHAPPKEGVVLFEDQLGSGFSAGGVDTGEIKRGAAGLGFDWAGRGRVIGSTVVPNGIATVRVTCRIRAAHGRPTWRYTTTQPVIGNVLVFAAPRRATNASVTMRWRDARGRVVRVVRE